MIKLSRTVLGASLLALSGLACASTTVVTVDAAANSISGSGSALDTDVYLLAGQAFSVSATGQWQNNPSPSYISDADGSSTQTYTLVSNGVTYTYSIGTLVGEIGESGVYFDVGTSFSGAADATGDLKLFYWDSDSFNNSGSVTAAISSVPEPADVALLLAALGGFAAVRRRRS